MGDPNIFETLCAAKARMLSELVNEFNMELREAVERRYRSAKKEKRSNMHIYTYMQDVLASKSDVVRARSEQSLTDFMKYVGTQKVAWKKLTSKEQLKEIVIKLFERMKNECINDAHIFFIIYSRAKEDMNDSILSEINVPDTIFSTKFCMEEISRVRAELENGDSFETIRTAKDRILSRFIEEFKIELRGALMRRNIKYRNDRRSSFMQRVLDYRSSVARVKYNELLTKFCEYLTSQEKYTKKKGQWAIVVANVLVRMTSECQSDADAFFGIYYKAKMLMDVEENNFDAFLSKMRSGVMTGLHVVFDLFPEIGIDWTDRKRPNLPIKDKKYRNSLFRPDEEKNSSNQYDEWQVIPNWESVHLHRQDSNESLSTYMSDAEKVANPANISNSLPQQQVPKLYINPKYQPLPSRQQDGRIRQ